MVLAVCKVRCPAQTGVERRARLLQVFSQQWAVIHVARSYQNWALMERVCEESVAQASRNLERAASLASQELSVAYSEESGRTSAPMGSGRPRSSCARGFLLTREKLPRRSGDPPGWRASRAACEDLPSRETAGGSLSRNPGASGRIPPFFVQ